MTWSAAVFQVGVDLVGVEVRGVRRQEVQLDPVAALGDPVGDRPGPVHGVPVENQVGLLGVLAQQPGEELQELRGDETALEQGEVHAPVWGDRGHGVEGEPFSGPGHRRCLSTPAPGPPGQVIGTDTDLVGEQDDRALGFGPFARAG